jgi:hypothetical protein
MSPQTRSGEAHRVRDCGEPAYRYDRREWRLPQIMEL